MRTGALAITPTLCSTCSTWPRTCPVLVCSAIYGPPAGITPDRPGLHDFALAQIAATGLVRTLQPTAGVMRHALPAVPVLCGHRARRTGAHRQQSVRSGVVWRQPQFTERAARRLRQTTTALAYRPYSPLDRHEAHAAGLKNMVRRPCHRGREVWWIVAHVGSFPALVGARCWCRGIGG
jgi:hypothetical protein